MSLDWETCELRVRELDEGRRLELALFRGERQLGRCRFLRRRDGAEVETMERQGGLEEGLELAFLFREAAEEWCREREDEAC